MNLRSLGLIAVTAFLSATFVVAPSSARPACAETVVLKTFHLVVESDKKVYKVGDTAKINVTVTRPAHEDPAGQNIPIEPPFSEPAANVDVGIGLRVGDVFLFGHSMTDENGKAAVKVRLEPWTPSGQAIADAFAWHIIQDTPCLRIEENGYQQKPNIFQVVKI